MLVPRQNYHEWLQQQVVKLNGRLWQPAPSNVMESGVSIIISQFVVRMWPLHVDSE
jgi:hypothetical protein